MASPFSIFRKHQRAMIAVLGILCMFAFTFTGFVGGFGSGSDGGSQQNPVAVTTSFGDFREGDLRDMRYQRNDIKKFLGQAILLTVDPQMRPFLEPRLSGMLESQIGPSTETALLETRVLAREAKQAGMVVSDDSVTDFLREQTGDQVRGEEFQTILDSLARGGRLVSKAMLYESLRTELLAMKMRQMFFFSSLQATPGQRWDFYKRLKRRVRVELAPVAAADFVAKIANPSDGVAQKFFDQYKDQEPQPGSPEPGFKIPHRAAFQYFEAHYQDFYHPEEIAEAEIKDHYEKFKDTQYLYNEPFGLTDEDEEPAAEKPAEDKPADKKPADKKPADKKPDDKKAEDKKPSEPGADGTKAAPEDRKKDDAKEPADDQQTDDKPKADDKTKADDKSEPNDAGSSCGADNSADDEEKATAGDDKKSSPSEKSEKSPAAADGDAATAATDKPPADRASEKAPAAPAGITPPQNAPVGGAPKTGSDAQSGSPGAHPFTGTQLKTKKSTAPPLSDRYVLPSDITKGPNPKYEPLWQAEPKIRKALAGTKAVEQMDKILNELKSKLRPYSDALVKWENRKQHDPNAPRPAPPDYQALAKNMRGVTPGRIPLSPDYQIAQVPGIGESQVSGQPFVAFAATGLKLFHAVESQDNDGNRYLFWKTDDQETRVPSLGDVREEVVQVWKLQQARRPMVEKAKELAKQARDARKSLKDALAGQPGIKVTETPPFSWMTTGSAGQFAQRAPPRLGEVPDTIDIGDEFMRSVFDLEVGDVGVAENHPQTVAYVVRVTTSEPPQPVLRDMFMADRFETYEQVVMQADRELYQQWLRDQMQAAKVHWVRQPYDEMRGE